MILGGSFEILMVRKGIGLVLNVHQTNFSIHRPEPHFRRQNWAFTKKKCLLHFKISYLSQKIFWILTWVHFNLSLDWKFFDTSHESLKVKKLCLFLAIPCLLPKNDNFWKFLIISAWQGKYFITHLLSITIKLTFRDKHDSLYSNKCFRHCMIYVCKYISDNIDISRRLPL